MQGRGNARSGVPAPEDLVHEQVGQDQADDGQDEQQLLRATGAREGGQGPEPADAILEEDGQQAGRHADEPGQEDDAIAGTQFAPQLELQEAGQNSQPGQAAGGAGSSAHPSRTRTPQIKMSSTCSSPAMVRQCSMH